MPDELFPLSLFHHTAAHVRGYQTFLAAQKVGPTSIASLEDFSAHVPFMEKDNYLRVYPITDLVVDGKIPVMVSASSGSSGKPFYWPRGDEQEIAGSKLHKRILCDIFAIGKSRTLVIVCFSMGNWIAGTFTAASCRHLATEENLNLSIITPGIEKEDILAILRDFAPNFETVILAGYPPFLMDIITEANHREISLSAFALKFLFAGENFSEHWRERICTSAGIANIPQNTISVYGTADAGALGHENPLTISIRKRAAADPAFRDAFFGETGFVPSLVQYDPESVYFESISGQLALTAAGGIPLIRYNIKDRGRIISSSEVAAALGSFGDREDRALMDAWQFPLVALYGRDDVAVTFYALNIYPENIKAGIEHKTFSHLLTGKFIARVDRSNDELEQTLIVTFELAPKITPDESLTNTVGQALFESLTTLNAEYRKLHASIKERARPVVAFVSHGDEQFIVRKSKHGWVQKK